MRFYLYTLICGFSVLINAILGGRPCETLSFRSAEARKDGRKWGCLLCRLLDAFDHDHCERAYHWWMRQKSTGELAESDQHEI